MCNAVGVFVCFLFFRYFWLCALFYFLFCVFCFDFFHFLFSLSGEVVRVRADYEGMEDEGDWSA